MVRFTLLENGYPHTTGLTELDVLEMIERYSRIFPENEYCSVPDEQFN